MRQRVTFFHAPESPVDPELLHVAETALAGPTIRAAREDRATLALDELPTELKNLLGSGVHELHVRWARPQASELVSPLLARLSPGLHVFFTPTTLGKQLNVCLLLKGMFGQSLPCETTATSFTPLGINGRFSHSAAFQYYAPLDSLSVFGEYVKTQWCASAAACPLRIAELEHAASLDLSYDTISHALKMTALWPPADGRLYATSSPGSRTEVGVLAPDTPPTLGSYELGMAGHVAVLGQDDHPSRVMFSFPSRHRYAGSEKTAFSAAFLQPTGLHPTLELRIASGAPPRGGSNSNDDDGYLAPQCKLHAYLTLPRHIFADKYQLSDPLYLASKNLSALHSITQPVDLEAPNYAVKLWGSAVLMELAPPPQSQSQPEAAVWTAQIPLHLRYLQPADGGYRSVDVPYPVVFWACAAEEGTKFATNPFDRVNLGYDGLFGPRTEFWHLDPNPRLQSGAPLSQAVLAGDRLTIPLRVPVLDASQAQWVNAGTGAVILLGLSWVLWKILAVYRKEGYGRVPAGQTPPSVQKKTQ